MNTLTYAQLGLSSDALMAPDPAAKTTTTTAAAATPFVLPDGAVSDPVVHADGSETVSVHTGGLTFNLTFDAAAAAAPESFRAGVEQAAAILSSAITDEATVNLAIDFAGTGGGAGANVSNGVLANYRQLRTDLVDHAAAGDTVFDHLPAGSKVQGHQQVFVSNAQAKVLGLVAPNDATTEDGFAVFNTDIPTQSLVGVALHELSHALGRVPSPGNLDIFDLFDFTRPGHNLINNSLSSAPPAYFSLDGGLTKIADYGQTSDPADFLNTGIQGANDPLNEFYNPTTSQTLSPIDLVVLEALGYNITTPDTQALLAQLPHAAGVAAPVQTPQQAAAIASAVAAETAASLTKLGDPAGAAQVLANAKADVANAGDTPHEAATYASYSTESHHDAMALAMQLHHISAN
ncbi:NF038122 family metalloprotease [Bradyrhizobium ontarionense]|uniref:NF038122 family metalloprotease n=1 Tax=Bradyrhizobium ontarionense TaxID=2898149 RepID=A0ABY3R3X0_9BRAD|nr:NF038122 family metalloprotease [Bradyrhizobium sp. A19]UFZ01724.1 NF038122 family metalloprotease [Bradyrhizobium sp. A19]